MGKEPQITLEQSTKAQRGLRCSSTLSLTSALDRGGWSIPRPGHFTPGNRPVSVVQEAAWAPGLVWTGFVPQTVQPVTSCNTAYLLNMRLAVRFGEGKNLLI